jgi:hypothetical protein
MVSKHSYSNNTDAITAEATTREQMCNSAEALENNGRWSHSYFHTDALSRNFS